MWYNISIDGCENLFTNINLHDDEFQYHPFTTTDVKFIVLKHSQVEHLFADLFGSIELQIVIGCVGFPLGLGSIYMGHPRFPVGCILGLSYLQEWSLA